MDENKLKHDETAAAAPDEAMDEAMTTADERMELMTKEEEARLPKMQLWERKLLDFSLRNNFLNLRIRGRVILGAFKSIVNSFAGS